MKNSNYCIIMAGGIGSRFWPVSTSNTPKQFIDMLGLGKSLLQLTYDRFKKIMPPDNILIVTSDKYKNLVLDQLPEVKPENVLTEPIRRNTAPCISYANFVIQSRTKNANVVVTPSDHLIIDEEAFVSNIKTGLGFVSARDVLLTIGIKPTRPDTGYGYIQLNEKSDVDERFNKVKTFTEKPNAELAKFFVESEEFLWNSGIFLWSAENIQEALSTHLPEVYNLFAEGRNKFGTKEERDFINKVYSESKNISIDYGVMEKAKNVYTLCADFSWSDLGTWKSLYENSKKTTTKNVITGSENVIVNNTHDCLIHVPPDKIAIVNDMENYIIVDSGDALLIHRFEKEQEIKEIVNDIKREFGEDKA
ncbi:MAG: mannose-1-phosphate guanylyltransferase [Bacteroidota bacterium]|nr:mannose-1-phosphate guanylyltransferase [Bacteroidota bacterium]